MFDNEKDSVKISMEKLFLQYLGELFVHSEIKSASVRDVIITREAITDSGKKAFEAGFHDAYSDIDLSVKVCLLKNGSITPEDYMKRIDRFGVSKDTALGWMFIPANLMYRIIFKNGMRYDFGFEFEYGEEDLISMESYADEEENEYWPSENINRFWFIQVQALGKLYRKDYLISSHLANMNCNDTLVMQMVIRDLKYGTSHHRYGYAEELEYTKDMGKNPYKNSDETFNRIADHLYATALAYDRLANFFYPEYKRRSEEFFNVWNRYESYRELSKTH